MSDCVTLWGFLSVEVMLGTWRTIPQECIKNTRKFEEIRGRLKIFAQHFTFMQLSSQTIMLGHCNAHRQAHTVHSGVWHSEDSPYPDNFQ